jgi:hypothetical protein
MRILLTTAGLLALAGNAAAQSLRTRVERAPDGEVRLAFTARDGICGDGATFIRDLNRDNYIRMDNWSGRDKWRDRPCEEGPVRVSLRVRGGEVNSARVYVGGGWSDAGAGVTDLGRLPAAEAARGLLDLARRSGTRAGDNLIFPATIADSIVVWPELLALARDRQAPRSSRKQAVFWVSQAAGDKAAEGLGDLVADGDEDREVRESAVFALSQLPTDEGVPILLRVARTNQDPKVRRTAMFWLGQSEDPRALALFEEILTKPDR